MEDIAKELHALNDSIFGLKLIIIGMSLLIFGLEILVKHGLANIAAAIREKTRN
jgi:hypothetical protein